MKDLKKIIMYFIFIIKTYEFYDKAHAHCHYSYL